MARRNWLGGTGFILLLLLAAEAVEAKVHAYFGVSGGLSLSGRFADFKNQTCLNPTANGFDLWSHLIGSNDTPYERCGQVIDNYLFNGPDTDSGGAWGLKLGLFGDSLPHFGLEFYYFERYPDVKRQNVAAAGPRTTALFPILPFKGTIEMDIEAVRTLSIAGVFRPFATASKESLFSRIKPYFALGVGITTMHMKEIRAYDSTGALAGKSVDYSTGIGVGFPLYAGIDFALTDSIWLTTEYTFSQALGLNFDTLDSAGETLTHYTDHIFMVGIKFWLNGSL